jgi:hypothetical protein
MSDMAIIPAGFLLTVTTGCYSDYSVSGVFRAKADIDAAGLRAEWLSDHPEQAEDYAFDESAFLGWIARRGLIEPMDCFEWHLGDYSCASEMRVYPM